ncbi:hypothetical protein NITMOv2_0364 [Nitrospira moscoviensis]|uniref:Uncharacterized protein n=1 Tax=Nitrospira moscoviensis TaxID=42253 RepID=A0A0K2G786_NITMO|nr:hypothetical protein NITMOv2_0364 [Nitrospira moscoviensis]
MFNAEDQYTEGFFPVAIAASGFEIQCRVALEWRSFEEESHGHYREDRHYDVWHRRSVALVP